MGLFNWITGKSSDPEANSHKFDSEDDEEEEDESEDDDIDKAYPREYGTYLEEDKKERVSEDVDEMLGLN